MRHHFMTLRTCFRHNVVTRNRNKPISPQLNLAYQMPRLNSSSSQASPHRTFYTSHGYPILKVFLGALFTYQLLYWTWLKLESYEIQEEKSVEIQRLEKELERIVQEKKSKS